MEIRSVLPADAIPSVDEPAFGPDYFGDGDDEVVVVDRPGAPPAPTPSGSCTTTKSSTTASTADR